MNRIDAGPPPPRSHARMWVSTFLLAIYAGFVLLVTMWPQPEQLEFGGIADRVLRALHNVGVPEWFDYDMLEFTANIGMFVPLGFLLGLALPRRGWWVALFLIPGFSGGIEYVQGIALEERVSTVQDVLANTLGGFLGLLVAMILRAMIHARDRTKIARALWERRAELAEFQRQQASRAEAAEFQRQQVWRAEAVEFQRQQASRASAQAGFGHAPHPSAQAGFGHGQHPEPPVRPAAPRVRDPDPVTRVMDPDFWNTGDAPTVRLPVQ